MKGLDRRLLTHFDWTLFALVAGLGVVGLLSIHSASYQGPHQGIHPLVVRQTVWLVLGTGLMIGVALLDYRTLSAYAYPLYVLAVASLALVDLMGYETGGSRRWLDLGLLRVEPSEMAKLAVVLVTVRYLREEPPEGGWGLTRMLVPVVLLLVPAALVMKQPDLGSVMILALVVATLMFTSGLSSRAVMVVALVGLMAAPLGWHYLKPYQRQRLITFVNPQADPLGAGYHVIQSEIAIGAGGALGKGFTRGTQARLNFLPEQSTDFIFSVFAEEFGLAGSIFLLTLFAGLIWRGAWIARHARDRVGSMLATGLTAIVFWQVVINLGMATGMVPVVGITLPLVSYGGSSVLSTMAAIGMLISINSRRYLF